jgi:hypothetical protein
VAGKQVCEHQAAAAAGTAVGILKHVCYLPTVLYELAPSRIRTVPRLVVVVACTAETSSSSSPTPAPRFPLSLTTTDRQTDRQTATSFNLPSFLATYYLPPIPSFPPVPSARPPSSKPLWPWFWLPRTSIFWGTTAFAAASIDCCFVSSYGCNTLTPNLELTQSARPPKVSALPNGKC